MGHSRFFRYRSSQDVIFWALSEYRVYRFFVYLSEALYSSSQAQVISIFIYNYTQEYIWKWKIRVVIYGKENSDTKKCFSWGRDLLGFVLMCEWEQLSGEGTLLRNSMRRVQSFSWKYFESSLQHFEDFFWSCTQSSKILLVFFSLFSFNFKFIPCAAKLLFIIKCPLLPDVQRINFRQN